MNTEMLNNLVILASQVLRFYGIKHYLNLFVREEESRWAHVEVFYIIVWLMTTLPAIIFRSPLLNICTNIAGMFVLLMPYRISYKKRCFAVFSIYALNVLVDCIVVLLMMDYTVGRQVDPVAACLVSLMIFLVAIVLERTLAPEKDLILPLGNMIALALVPVISIFCMHALTIAHPESKNIIILVAGVLIFINILIFYLYHALLRFYSERMHERVLEQMIEVYTYQLEIAQESQQRIQALRHDMKHHLIELESMIQKDQKQELIRYLNDMKEFMLNPKEYVSSANKEIDGILNYLLQRAEKCLKKVEVQVNIPKQLYHNNFKICVILGNLVDNAIRAADESEEKEISVKIQTRQELLWILIENTYLGEIISDGERFRSTQNDLGIHGIGLENVKKIVLSCGGDLKIDYSDHRFCVQVLLYLSNMKR